MEMQEFKDEIKEHIRDFLPEKYENASVDFSEIHKNNQVLEGLIIRDESVNVTPTIYVNDLFNQANDGRDMNEIMAEIARIYVDHTVDKDFDISHVTEYGNVEDKIFPRVIGKENNEELLSERPHMEVAEDLAITYHIALGEGEDGAVMSIPISEGLMKSWDISKEELHETAMKNMAENMDISFMSMSEVISEMMVGNMINDGMTPDEARETVEQMLPPDDMMFVLGNAEKTNGAVAMFDSKTMEDIAERLGCDFFVLPSSIHECLIVPMKDGAPERESLESMVREVNATQVAPADRLSDSVYAYDAEDKAIMRVDRYEERQSEKVLEKANEKNQEPKSFKEQLKEAKEDQVKLQEKAKNTKENSKKKTVGIGD